MKEKYDLNYKTVSVDNPMAELSLEEKIKLMRAAGKDAAAKFDQMLKRIHKWFDPSQDYDQTYLLAYCFRYFVMTKEGYDEEAETGALSFPPHYLEFLQALAIIHPRNYSTKPLWDKGGNLLNEMQELGNLMVHKLFEIPSDVSTQDELNAYKVRVKMMSYHLSVRNWAYYSQMKKVTRDMAVFVGKAFIDVHSVDPAAFVDLIFEVSEEVTKRINNHLRKLRSALVINDPFKLQDAYASTFLGIKRESKKGKGKMWEMSGRNLDDLRLFLTAHSDLRLVEAFTFTAEELSHLSRGKMSPRQIEYLLDYIAFGFGDLKDVKQEFILLDNPVHDKPFVKLQKGVYFSSLWSTIPHLSINLLESLVSSDDSLRKLYNNCRAEYLENTLFDLCKSSFPNGQVFKGSTWLSEGKEHKRFENDILVIIDSFALVFEAKSGMLTKAAKRGATDRLFKTLKDLIEAPSEQALRFIEFLKNNKGKLSLPTKHGVNNIDVSNVNYFIPIGVTFYDLGMAGTNLKDLIEGKVTSLKIEELAPSISLTDLQVAFELLDCEAQRIHYLHRRREVENSLEYFASELDLLAFYMDNGFNVGDYETNKNTIFQLALKSKELDPYFISKGISKNPPPRPKLKMTRLWEVILKRLEHKKSPRWIEFSYVLLNFNKGDQMQFEQAFSELKRRVRRQEVGEPLNWVEFVTANENRQYIVAGYAYTMDKHSTRREDLGDVIGHILDAHPRAKGVVVISVNVDNENYPYNSLAGDLSVTLFDDLFRGMSILTNDTGNQ